ncbi:TonB-dependent receptor [Sphingomonas sp. PP-CC-3G-468]|uniref:TonB-dependent receptor domain-containing protein n=1 Tax=Sphingomonas sp. PP-CC-3G-468 TaxID=2135656 RepID=UPI00105168DF|nr:TonB-dependent receptor [Sphingomonas sp. PP-CC-3G-468]TCM04544.1 TonB-dependent receptor-like protein [Sphingomonas sp. PP-CC-3G-468]
MINRKTAFCGASALAMMIAGTATAQVQPQPQPAVPAASPSASVTADGTSPAADTGAAQISSAGPAPSETADEDIVVTGSRIPANGFGAPTPVTVASATQLNAAVPTTLGEALKQLPALSSSVGPRGAQTSSGQGGAYLNLRNLGPTRTLTLFDGRRFIPNDGSGQVDTNLFPQALVERVEVVTGGASAAYGSDAVGGVVNFIINKKFTGLTGTIQGGVTTYGDNAEQKYELAYGTPFAGGRGHFLVSGEFFRNEGVEDRLSRSYSRKSCQPIALPAGSATSREFACDVRVANATFGGLITGPTAFRGTTFDASGQPIPFIYGTSLTNSTMIGGSGPRPQFAPLISELEKHIAYTRASYELSDAVTVFAEGNYGKTHNDYQVGSYSNQIGTTALVIRRDNAYLPTTIRDRMTALGTQTLTMGRYDDDLPRTQVNADNETIRGVLGLEGTVFGGLKWNTYVEAARNDRHLALTNDLIQQNYVNAADAVVNPANGQIVCRSTLTTPGNGCVPVNVFGFHAPTDAALNYVTGTNTADQRFKEFVAAGSIAGSAFQNWAGDVGFAAGLEYRKQSFNQTVDALSEAFNPVTNAEGAYRVGNAKAQSGEYEVTEGFLEVDVPLLRDVNLFKALDFNGAVRRTHYTTSGSVTTWKAGLTWAINDELRFRGTRSRDIRAPSLYELFQRGTTSFQPQVFDRATNSTATNVRSVVLGNLNLTPEVAKTTTFGAVYSPSFLRGFNASIDFYDIRIKDAIASLSFQQTLDDCFNGSAASCAFVRRNDAGQLIQIDLVTQNLAAFDTRGIDFEMSYKSRIATDANMSLRLLGNYVDRYIQRTPNVVAVDRAGQIGTAPHWRMTGQVQLDAKPFSVFTQGRFIGGGAYDKGTVPTDLAQRHFNGQLLVDTRIGYKLPMGGDVETYLSVTNVFNQLINPYVSNGPSGVQDFDSIGRTFRAGVRFTF